MSNRVCTLGRPSSAGSFPERLLQAAGTTSVQAQLATKLLPVRSHAAVLDNVERETKHNIAH